MFESAKVPVFSRELQRLLERAFADDPQAHELRALRSRLTPMFDATRGADCFRNDVIMGRGSTQQ